MKLHLSKEQLKKLKSCSKLRKLCKLRLSLTRKPNRDVPNLSQKQLYLIHTAKNKKKKFVTIEFSPQQIGGLLPLIIPGLIAAAKAAGLGAATFMGSKLMQKITGKGKRKKKKKGGAVYLPGIGKSKG
jgi:hypothetical protein